MAQPAAAGVDGPLATYNDEIPIDVPEFHGIEPKLTLSYDSSGKAGPTGVGWNLVGIGKIERARSVGSNAERRTPRAYTSSPNTGRPLLTSVRQNGRDAGMIDAMTGVRPGTGTAPAAAETTVRVRFDR